MKKVACRVRIAIAKKATQTEIIVVSLPAVDVCSNDALVSIRDFRDLNKGLAGLN